MSECDNYVKAEVTRGRNMVIGTEKLGKGRRAWDIHQVHENGLVSRLYILSLFCFETIVYTI